MSCPETSALEALHDNRLAAEHAEALRLHLVTCAACSREAERFEHLSLALMTLPGPDASPLRVDAGRRRLLEAASRLDRVGSPPHAPAWPFGRALGLVLTACVAVALVAFAVHRGMRREATAAVAPKSAPDGELALSVTPSPGTKWSRVSSDVVETLKLTDGELGVRVTRHGSRRRLLVALPDGELEDVGTVFTVVVHGEETRTVAVTEGRVLLRLRGKSELVLSAGESFHAPDDTGRGTANAPSALAPTVTPEAPRPAATSAKNGSRPSPSGEESPACPEASLFQDGVQAFKRGEYASAASLLERFSAACGRGNHGEDAAYLRMVALARAGRTADARAQARAYLERFPEGFRRKEAERLAGSE